MDTYEKKYYEALGRAQKATRAGGDVAMDIVQYIFPELAKSEAERIWDLFYCTVLGTPDDSEWFHDVSKDSVLAYLEKQKDSKWSPSEDEMGVLYKLCYISNQVTDEDDTNLTRLYQDLKREYFNGHSFENMFPSEKQKESLHISETCKENPGSFTDEDERIRRAIIGLLEEIEEDDTYCGLWHIKSMIAYLEKQKEIPWSEEDEAIVKTMCEEADLIPSERAWLMNLKNRICKESLHISETCKENPDSFTDEDERIRKIIYLALVASEDELSAFYETHGITRKECTDWLEKQKGKMTAEEFESSELFQLKLKTKYANGYQDGLAQKEQKPLSPDEKMNHPLYLEGFDVGREVGKVEAEQKPAEVKPRFKIGDTLKKINKDYTFVVDKIQGGFYLTANHSFFPIEEQDNWELVEQKPAEYGDEFITEAEEYASKVNCGEYKVEVTEAYIAGALRANNKPAEWSEFDEDCLKRAIWYIENPAPSVVKDTNLALWLKSLPLNLKKKNEDVAKLCSNEWSEEDFEKLVGELVQDIVANESDAKNYGTEKKPTSFFLTKYSEKFKSIRPHWKLSEEQTNCLMRVITWLVEAGNTVDSGILADLKKQLETR